jgi:Rho termination factor, N-terminal domain
MTTTELAAMTLPKLKEVASQLGIEGAAKLKKDALVTARQSVKLAVKLAMRSATVPTVIRNLMTSKIQMTHQKIIQVTQTPQTMMTTHLIIVATVTIATTVVTATAIDVIAIVIAMVVTVIAMVVTVVVAKSANRLLVKTMFLFQ